MPKAIELQLKGYRLTTAEITYRLPDHRDLLQIYVWQQYDLAPRFPELAKFLDFWTGNLEGPIHSVKVAATGIFQPIEFDYIDQVLTVH